LSVTVAGVESEKSDVAMTKVCSDSNLTEKRMKLFKELDFVLGLSHKKSDQSTVSNPDRQRWLRLLITAVDSYGSLLKDMQLESIETRLKTVEVRVDADPSILKQYDLLFQQRTRPIDVETSK